MIRRVLRNLWFVVTDTFKSRKGKVEQHERREFYRNASDIYGRGLGGAGASQIRRHTTEGLRPDPDRR